MEGKGISSAWRNQRGRLAAVGLEEEDGGKVQAMK